MIIVLSWDRATVSRSTGRQVAGAMSSGRIAARPAAEACHSLSPGTIGETAPTLTPFAEQACAAHGTNTEAV
jgi:hypothetical protein